MGRPEIPADAAAGNAEPDFVSRWSKRKHASRRAAEALVDGETNSDGVAARETEADHGSRSQPELLTDADMPDIDSLTYDSAYKDFLSPRVSEQLRKLALRKLFHSEIFNIRDGLDEYDDDFTQFEKLGDTVTSDMRHQMEMEARRKAEQLLDQDEQPPGADSRSQRDSRSRSSNRHSSTLSAAGETTAKFAPSSSSRAPSPSASPDSTIKALRSPAE